MAKFGPAGNSDSFSRSHKSTAEAPAWLRRMGLDLLEYQCGRGVHMGRETAEKIGAQAAEHGVLLSVHAPYFINLSSDEPERRQKNEQYVLQSCQVAQWLGADRIVVHCGGLSGRTRAQALENSIQGLAAILGAMEDRGFGDISLCVETMGKQNVMGSLEEIAAICQSDERLAPCIDFGHLNARGQGCLKTAEDFIRALEYLESALGRPRMQHFHAHFSHIEYGRGGETRHLTFADSQFGPEFPPCAQALAERGLQPRIICESAGTQAEDAQIMQQIYRETLEKIKSRQSRQGLCEK